MLAQSPAICQLLTGRAPRAQKWLNLGRLDALTQNAYPFSSAWQVCFAAFTLF